MASRRKDAIKIGDVTALLPSQVRGVVEAAVSLADLAAGLLGSVQRGGVKVAVAIDGKGRTRVGVDVGEDETEEVTPHAHTTRLLGTAKPAAPRATRGKAKGKSRSRKRVGQRRSKRA